MGTWPPHNPLPPNPHSAHPARRSSVRGWPSHVVPCLCLTWRTIRPPRGFDEGEGGDDPRRVVGERGVVEVPQSRGASYRCP